MLSWAWTISTLHPFGFFLGAVLGSLLMDWIMEESYGWHDLFIPLVLTALILWIKWMRIMS